MSGSQPLQTKQWILPGGERFYALARWLTILLLFLITNFLTDQPVWPVSSASPPLVVVFWIYVAVSVLATLALFIPPLATRLELTYLIDIGFISLMMFFGGEQIVIFFPLYLVPLINAAIRQTKLISLLSGIVAALCYIAAFIGWRRIFAADLETTFLEYVALFLRGLTLIFVPWITAGLAERWSENNRVSVQNARHEAEKALEEAHAYRAQSRSLYEVAYTLSSTVDYGQVLEVTLRESYKLTPYTAGMVLLSAGVPDELYVGASHRLSISDQARQIKVTAGLAEALHKPNPHILDLATPDPDLLLFDSLTNCRYACLIPLRANLRTYGIVVFAIERAETFAEDEIAGLTALVNYAIIALHNAQLIFDLQEERNKLISKEEEVRHQLARDLHDGPAQAVAAITMNVEFIKRLLERDPERVLDELDKLSALAKRTTYEVRTMLFELRPLVLETQGLKVTLEQYLQRFQQNSTGTKLVLEADGLDEVHLETKTEGTLFNIIQESINNALKHARAKHIWVRLQRDGNNLIAVVQDDGIGFDLNEIMRSYEKRGSFGLLNIDERARLVNGTAELASTPGQGTKVTITVPINTNG
ncbi:GAF domain-containing sensor histidine kinase [Candidatus Chloroploca asiatica]|uniref:Histidine kinase n=1 Tax=Candidatus Chloroploca asiatica TaxID=1506545 RepID=A0A2H3KHJ2_9CHLR|nr:histidine kinase [Candidatus Chloroploca asiatica]